MNNIPFRDFIKIYDFRYVNDLANDYNEDTQIIRVYPPSDDFDRDNWFEFGIYDFSGRSAKEKKIENIFSKEILDCFVESISFNQEYNKVLAVFLTKHKIVDD